MGKADCGKSLLVIVGIFSSFLLLPMADGHKKHHHHKRFLSEWRQLEDSNLESMLYDPIHPSDSPTFDHPSLASNVLVKKDSDAYLHCRVNGLGEQSVSWYKRRKDQIQLITFGYQTYHNDNRFSLHFLQPNDWRLRINEVEDHDEGTYECQVTTHPPITRTVELSVVVPSIRLLDNRGVGLEEKFYKTGSTIVLRCEVRNVPTRKHVHLAWYQGNRRLNYDDPRGGISVKTEIRGFTAKSWLRIGNAVPTDSGTYHCTIAGLQPASGRIHVVKEESTAAFQSSSGNTGVHFLLNPFLLSFWIGLVFSRAICSYNINIQHSR